MRAGHVEAPAALLLISSCLFPQIYAQQAELSGKDGHKVRFQTEPDYLTSYFAVEQMTDNPSLLAPGYIFIDPVHGAKIVGRGGFSLGPQIREPDGTLIWYGGEKDSFGDPSNTKKAPDRLRVQDFHVCDYMNTTGTHLCWSEKAEGRRRKKVVLDQSYELVKEFHRGYEYGDKVEYPNMHEFNMVDDGFNYLTPAWPEKTANLKPYGGDAHGLISDGCFQEISVETDEPNFEWCWMDHYNIWETNLFPSGGPNITGNITSIKVGPGSSTEIWDAYHVNAMDKNFEGDYLLSCRHDDQISMIAGLNNVHGVEPGTSLWRLGGRGSTISIEGNSFNFSKQHGVRFRSTTAEEVVFTILDNAWEGALAPTSDVSSGMVISVNNRTMTAKLLKRYSNPSGAVSPSQGSFQTLPNGNVFMGWGSRSQFTEFTEDGDVLLHASYTNETTDAEEMYTYSYRLWKSPWVGKPTYAPKLITYKHDCGTSSPLMAWVSWNGATEVDSWSFHIANEEKGPWWVAGTWPRTGYETEANLSKDPTLATALQKVAFPKWVSVTALDMDGNTLDYGTRITQTFVPKKNIRKEHCTPSGCFEDIGFNYAQNLSCADTCGGSYAPQFLVLMIIIALIEFVDLSYGRLSLSWSTTWPGILDDAEMNMGYSDDMKPTTPVLDRVVHEVRPPSPLHSRNPSSLVEMVGDEPGLVERPGFQRNPTQS